MGLEFAQRHPEKLDLLALINGSMSMKMNTELLDLALNKDQKAVDLMMDWVHGPLGHKGGHPVPGLSHLGMGGQLVSSNNDGTLVLTSMLAINTQMVKLLLKVLNTQLYVS